MRLSGQAVVMVMNGCWYLRQPLASYKGRYVLYWGGGGGVNRGILEFFGEKSRGPSTSWNGLMHDPSEIPKQKHLTLPLYLSKTKITGSENNKLEVLLIVTSVNLKKAGMASRNIVMKKNTRCFKSALL